jgi:hypothetical protein
MVGLQGYVACTLTRSAVTVVLVACLSAAGDWLCANILPVLRLSKLHSYMQPAHISPNVHLSLWKNTLVLYRFPTALPSLYQPPSTICSLHILSPSPYPNHLSIQSTINQRIRTTTSRPPTNLYDYQHAVPLSYFRWKIFDLYHYYHFTKWLAQAEVLQGVAIPSLERDARLARGGTSAVMKHSHNGNYLHLHCHHVHCSRSFSRNCTKHQVRCDYMDSPTAMMPDSPQSPQQPNLLWTSDIEATIELWRQTGDFPFPDLRLYPQPDWRALSRTDLRLIHHLSSISNEMFRNRASKSTLWTDMMPK